MKIPAIPVLIVMPLFFSSNLVIGRGIIDEVEPWTLAFLRWSIAFLVLLPFTGAGIWTYRTHILRHWQIFSILGFLGMWISGAVVYFALGLTTATNATLIYTTSPVMILLMEAVFTQRKISFREILGILLAFSGVSIVIFKGSLAAIFNLSFNVGDILMLFAAISWAIYSILLKKNAIAKLPNSISFTAIALFGTITLLPFAWHEVAVSAIYPHTKSAWLAVFGLATVSSIFSFGCYQFGVRRVGPTITGIFLYLLPFYGICLAVVFLGEQLFWFHIWGSILIVGGVGIATLPFGMLKVGLRLFAPKIFQ